MAHMADLIFSGLFDLKGVFLKDCNNINSAAVAAGGFDRPSCKKGLPERVSKWNHDGHRVMLICAGVKGYFDGNSTIVAILSLALGTGLGELLRLEERLNRLGERIGARVSRNGGSRVGEGLVTATLLFCVGAMAVARALQSGITGDHTTLYTKSLIDFISAILLASTYGVGVVLSAVGVFVYQGAITLLSGLLAPVMTAAAVAELSAVGSVLLVGLGLNLAGARQSARDEHGACDLHRHRARAGNSLSWC